MRRRTRMGIEIIRIRIRTRMGTGTIRIMVPDIPWVL